MFVQRNKTLDNKEGVKSYILEQETFLKMNQELNNFKKAILSRTFNKNVS